MNVFFGISFFVQPMHARMRAERGLFWYDSLHWYDSPYNTSSTELLGFGATFGVPIRTPLRALSRYSSASGKSTVPEPLFSGLLYLCLFVCLFVCFYCTRGASLPPIYCTSGSGQIYCTKHLWYKGGGPPHFDLVQRDSGQRCPAPTVSQPDVYCTALSRVTVLGK